LDTAPLLHVYMAHWQSLVRGCYIESIRLKRDERPDEGHDASSEHESGHLETRIAEPHRSAVALGGSRDGTTGASRTGRAAISTSGRRRGGSGGRPSLRRRRSGYFNVERLGGGVYLREIGSVNEVDDVARVGEEGDVRHGESAVGEVNTILDRELSVEDRRIGVGDGDEDGVWVTLVESPSNGIGDVLNPEAARARGVDGDSEGRGDKAECSDSLSKHGGCGG